MDFSSEYELIEQIGGGAVETFRVRHIGSGRVALLHRFGKDADPRQIVQVLQLTVNYLMKVPSEQRKEILDFGEYGGASCLLTEDLPECRSLGRWLASGGRSTAQEPAPAAAKQPPDGELPGEFTRMFNAPSVREVSPAPSSPASVDEAPPHTEPPPTSAVQPSTREPGEFTRMFQAQRGKGVTDPVQPGPPAPTQPAPPASTEPLPAPPETGTPQPVGKQAGEFTHFFHSTMFQEALGRKASPAPPPTTPPPAAEVPPLAPPQPEKLTQTSQAPASGGVPEVPPLPAPEIATQAQAQERGEFTRMFQSPPASTRIPPLRTEEPTPPQGRAPSPAAREPGEFTRMFQPPHSGGPVPPVPPAPPRETAPPREMPPPSRTGQPGEFTRMFQSLPTAYTPKEASVPSTPETPMADREEPTEFTKLFQSPAGGSAGTPSTRKQAQGDFTLIFGTPAGSPAPFETPRPPQTPASTGATALFRTPAGPPVTSGGTGPQGPSEFTRVIQGAPTPAGQAPAPAVAAQPSPTPPAARTSTLLIVFIVLGVAAVGLVLFVLLRG